MNLVRAIFGGWILMSAGLSGAGAGEKPSVPSGLYRVWFHSREEDKDGIQVYRPEGYEFPPSRGRAGFEIRKGGEFIDRPIAPADGNEMIPGRWESAGQNKIRVTFPKHPDRRAFTLEIVSCDGQVLKVRRTDD